MYAQAFASTALWHTHSLQPIRVGGVTVDHRHAACPGLGHPRDLQLDAHTDGLRLGVAVPVWHFDFRYHLQHHLRLGGVGQLDGWVAAGCVAAVSMVS